MRDAVKLAKSIENTPKLNLEELPVGAMVIVNTKNSEYRFTKKSKDDYEVVGGRFEKPTLCRIHGCTFGGSMLLVGRLCDGMRLEFSTEELNAQGKVMLTSTIQQITSLVRDGDKDE